MQYFDISDDGKRLEKIEFANAKKLDSDKNEYCCLWHYKNRDMELLGRFTLPVNLRSIAHKLPNIAVHELLDVFEKGYLVLSDVETIQIEPE